MAVGPFGRTPRQDEVPSSFRRSSSPSCSNLATSLLSGRAASAMREHPHCRAFGLSIRSELPLPGAMAIGPYEPEHDRAPDLEIIEGSATLAGPWTESGPYRYAHNVLRYERPGTARYLCEGGARIVVERVDGARPFDVSASLIATALPAILWMRGEIVLHAAAAVLPGCAGAIAIAGPSGSGKSTILRQLIAAGAKVAADDTVCVRLRGDRVEVSGLPAAYFLAGSSVDANAQRVMLAVPDGQQLASVDLAAFVVLDSPRVPRGFASRNLHGSFGLEALLGSRHRRRIPRLLGRERELFARFIALPQRFPMYAWSRQEGAATLDAHEMSFLTAAAHSARATAAEEERPSALEIAGSLRKLR